jgi:hypothetical protein
MHSLAPEIRALQAAGEVDAAACESALAREERRAFSVRPELLAGSYAGVASLVAGAGLLLRNNLDRIGPATLLTAMLAAAAVSYVLALRRRPRGVGGDYLLLLGALLLSASVGYAELHFGLLGGRWSLHLLLLAVVHGLTAYAFDSRLVLAVALGALAGWVGVDLRFVTGPGLGTAVGWRALALAALYLAAGFAHRRLRGPPSFPVVYQQFAINFAFCGALALGFAEPTRWAGAALLLGLALIVGRIGLRRRRESLVLYAIGYATFGLVALEAQLLRDPLLVSNLGLLTIGGAVLLLFRLRPRLKDSSG